MLDASPELEKQFAQPVAAVLKGSFLIGVVFRVQRERQEQLAADIRQTIPKPRQKLKDADRMEPWRGNEFLYGLLAEDICGCRRQVLAPTPPSLAHRFFAHFPRLAHGVTSCFGVTGALTLGVNLRFRFSRYVRTNGPGRNGAGRSRFTFSFAALCASTCARNSSAVSQCRLRLAISQTSRFVVIRSRPTVWNFA